ncbi:MAG: DUF6635 family protein [Candidatus Thiodiazotropha sp. L084R]
MSEQIKPANNSSQQAELKLQVTAHISACRERIPQFIKDNYAWPGAWHLNRRAWGWDIAIAPVNFILGFPNFLVRLMALLFEFLKLKRIAHWLNHLHLGFSTRIQQHLLSTLNNDLLKLPEYKKPQESSIHNLIISAASEPSKLYIQTRNVAADITAGTLAAILGLIFFHQFTPGSISAGSLIAKEIARDQAINGFLFGETLGKLYYTLAPVTPSINVILISLIVIMTIIAIVAAFSGIIHDPVQTATGIHQRRLNKLFDAIEESACSTLSKGYRPKDTFFGRVYDLIDWIKGVLYF